MDAGPVTPDAFLIIRPRGRPLNPSDPCLHAAPASLRAAGDTHPWPIRVHPAPPPACRDSDIAAAVPRRSARHAVPVRPPEPAFRTRRPKAAVEHPADLTPNSWPASAWSTGWDLRSRTVPAEAGPVLRHRPQAACGARNGRRQRRRDLSRRDPVSPASVRRRPPPILCPDMARRECSCPPHHRTRNGPPPREAVPKNPVRPPTLPVR